ncbi:hypothetical protein [Sulfurimonas marina]|uniref:Uncharacterized protein n=1 Tax=Sulfurimonas marina TaxID=2590551 RepID=A0A7M1ATK0_9BACT|nr:hypothetical protein [Sulfurimonas marina]QOP40741.1 hypothetical protein FJR03_02890 [Sulfurimonas marina]
MYKKILLVVGAMFVFTGCDPDTVSLVKNGKLDKADNFTVGKALDTWSACKESKWTENLDEDNEKYVEFVCTLKTDLGLHPLEKAKVNMDIINEAKENQKKLEEKYKYGKYKHRDEFNAAEEKIVEAEDEYIADKIRKTVLIMQFNVNTERETFNLGWTGYIHYMKDGGFIPDTRNSLMQDAYDDLEPYSPLPSSDIWKDLTNEEHSERFSS